MRLGNRALSGHGWQLMRNSVSPVSDMMSRENGRKVRAGGHGVSASNGLPDLNDPLACQDQMVPLSAGGT